MLQKALKYPRNSNNAVRTIGIGGLLGLFGFLVAPPLFILGYLVEVLDTVIDGQTRPPDFENYEELLVDGTRSMLVVFGYFSLPLFILLVQQGAAMAMRTPGSSGATGSSAASILLTALAVITAILSSYLAPAGIANFARTGQVSDAFSVREIFPVVTNGTYAMGWIVGGAVSLVGTILVSLGFLFSPFVAFPVVYVLAAFVNFYVAVAAFYIFGRSYADARPVTPTPDTARGTANPLP
jgi:hypothetical protein